MQSKECAIVSVLVAAVFLFLATGTVVAETNETNSTDLNNTNSTGLNETNSTGSNSTITNSTNQTSCVTRERRVEGRLRQYREGRDGHFRSFINLRDHLIDAIERLASKGYNVSVLDADLIVLDEKIDTFKADYALFIDKLAATRNASCGNSTTFRGALQAAKAQLRIVRQDANMIKDFMKETVREHIRELRKDRREVRKEAREAEREATKEAREQLRTNRSAERELRKLNRTGDDDDEDQNETDDDDTTNRTGGNVTA